MESRTSTALSPRRIKLPSLVSYLVVNVLYCITTKIDLQVKSRLEVCNEWSVGVLSYRKDHFTGLFFSKEANKGDLLGKGSDVLILADPQSARRPFHARSQPSNPQAALHLHCKSATTAKRTNYALHQPDKRSVQTASSLLHPTTQHYTRCHDP